MGCYSCRHSVLHCFIEGFVLDVGCVSRLFFRLKSVEPLLERMRELGEDYRVEQRTRLAGWRTNLGLI